MFDIGFAELLVICIVGLLVIGPERLPGAIRTASVWINRFRRSFNEVKAEVQRELHNDEVLRELRANADNLQQELRNVSDPLKAPIEEADSAFRPEIDALSGSDVAQPDGAATDQNLREPEREETGELPDREPTHSGKSLPHE